jgi:hypothetical protein
MSEEEIQTERERLRAKQGHDGGGIVVTFNPTTVEQPDDGQSR